MLRRPSIQFCLCLLLLGALSPACRPVPARDDQPIHLVRPRAPKYTPAPSRSLDQTPLKDLRAQSRRADKTMIGSWPSTGRAITMDAQHEPIRSVLDHFARVSRLNFVLSDDTKGQVTCVFDRVPWTRALRTILLAKDLVAVIEGNVVRIMPRTSYQEELRQTR